MNFFSWPGEDGGGGPAPTPAPEIQQSSGTNYGPGNNQREWQEQGGREEDSSSSMLPSWQFTALCVALAFLVCYLRAHPEVIQKIKDKFQGNPEGTWIAVSGTDGDEESGGDNPKPTGAAAKKSNLGAASSAERASDAAQIARAERESLEAMTAHERARVISKRYRELRNEGKGASEAMEMAEAEVPRRKESISRPADTPAQAAPAAAAAARAPTNEARKEAHKGTPKEAPKEARGKSPQAARSLAAKRPPSPPPAPPAVVAVVEVPAGPGSAPTVSAEVLGRLVEAEARLTKYRSLRKEGYDEKQARFLAGLPGEVDDEEFLWTEVQDETTSDRQVYYWDGEDGIVKERPKENLWRVVVVFEDPESGNGVEAKEFEFGKGRWLDRGTVDLPPKLPAPPAPSLKAPSPTNPAAPGLPPKKTMSFMGAKKGPAAAPAKTAAVAKVAKGAKASPGRASKSEPRGGSSNPLAGCGDENEGDDNEGDDDGATFRTAVSGASSTRSSFSLMSGKSQTPAEKKAAKARKDMEARNAKHEAEARSAQAKAKAAGSGVGEADKDKGAF